MCGSFVTDTSKSPRIFAFQGTKLIGIAVLRTMSASDDLVYPLVRLELVYVTPKYRNRGVAKHMIRELYEYAQDDCSLITSHAGQSPVVRQMLLDMGGYATCMRDVLEETIVVLPHPEQDLKELNDVCDKHYPDFFWKFEVKEPQL
jgi:GNAT superfamily N-acetyltransferase